MTDAPAPARARNIRIVSHDESIEVRFGDGRACYFYFDQIEAALRAAHYLPSL